MHKSFWQLIKTFFTSNFWLVKINYNCIFGALAIFFLVVAFFSGIFLHFHYSLNPFFVTHNAKWTTEHDTLLICALGFTHINSIHFLFLFLYIHLAVNLFNRTYKINWRTWFWNVLSLYFLTGAALNGSVLPATQLQSWTDFSVVNLFSRFPSSSSEYAKLVLNNDFDKVNLWEFYINHIIFALLAVISIFNCVRYTYKSASLLKRRYSNYGNSVSAAIKKIFSKKDLFIFLVVVLAFVMVLLFFPALFENTDQKILNHPVLNTNYTTSEWYLAVYHAIRDYAASSNIFYYCYLGSVIFIVGLPFFDFAPAILSPKYKLFFNLLNCIFLFSLLALGYIGFTPPTVFSIYFSKVCVVVIIIYFFILCELSVWVITEIICDSENLEE